MTMAFICLRGNKFPCLYVYNIIYGSSAIMKYIVSKYQLPDHWYPKDLEKRAKIDEYLYWHPGNVRMGAANYMFLKVNHLIVHVLYTCV